MFKLAESYYNDVWDKFEERYEDGKYRVIFGWSVDENKVPFMGSNPCDRDNVRLTIIPNDMLNGIRICVLIRKIGEKEMHGGSKLYIPDGETRYFNDIYGATGAWREAAESLVALDNLIREKFPGYYITNKKEY